MKPLHWLNHTIYLHTTNPRRFLTRLLIIHSSIQHREFFLSIRLEIAWNAPLMRKISRTRAKKAKKDWRNCATARETQQSETNREFLSILIVKIDFFSHFNSVWSVDDKSFSIIFNYLEYFYLTWPIRHRAPPSISYDLLGKSLNSWKLIPTGVLLCFWWNVKFLCDKIKKWFVGFPSSPGKRCVVLVFSWRVKSDFEVNSSYGKIWEKSQKQREEFFNFEYFMASTKRLFPYH